MSHGIVSVSNVSNLDMTLPLWSQAKHLSFIIDHQTPLGSGGLKKGDDGISYVTSSESTPEISRFHKILYELRIVAPEHSGLRFDLESPGLDVAEMSAEELHQLVTHICRADRFVEGTIAAAINSHLLTNAFRRLYLLTVCDDQGWPRLFPTITDRTVEEGIEVISLSGSITGRTTGSRRKCAANKCPGWFIGVLWETGQQMYICSEGWHYDTTSHSVRVIGGGEISARYVSPKPLGVDPLPKSEWPDRESLTRRKGWR